MRLQMGVPHMLSLSWKRSPAKTHAHLSLEELSINVAYRALRDM